MSYITEDTIAFYITMSANVAYAILFVYHLKQKDTNKSLLISTGCLCLFMVFLHSFSSYKASLPVTSEIYQQLANNYYIAWVIQDAILIIVLFLLHQLFKAQYHYAVIYIYRCMILSIFINVAVHTDITILGNRDPNWLWSLYSYTENFINVFLFLSVVIARRWSDIFNWLKLAHR